MKRGLICAILLLFPGIAFPGVFCIHSQDELLHALSVSSSNDENDTLRIVQDTTISDIALPSEIGRLLKIEGGYDADCNTRQAVPTIMANAEHPSVLAEEPIEPRQNTSGPVPSDEIVSKVELLGGGALSGGADVTVLGVPPYAWRHGCGPTAVGMVAGYWDGKGCDDLFDGNAASQTESVNQGIASQGSDLNPQHYEDYSLPKDSYPNLLFDKSELPAGDEHSSNSIADFMYTSWSSWGNYYGWSWSNHVPDAFNSYVEARNNSYTAVTQTYYYGSTLTWDVLTQEIDAQRPMVFLVDSVGDGNTDHFVTVVGYRIEGSTQYYACLDTWYPYNTIRWEQFRGMSNSYAWGVWNGYSFQIQCTSSPKAMPWLMLLLSN